MTLCTKLVCQRLNISVLNFLNFFKSSGSDSLLLLLQSVSLRSALSGVCCCQSIYTVVNIVLLNDYGKASDRGRDILWKGRGVDGCSEDINTDCHRSNR